MGAFEDKYNDVLRSIELAIVRVYRESSDLVDFQTLTAVNGLLRVYTAVSRKRTPPPLKLDDLAQRVFNDIKIACDGWMGQGPIFDEAGQIAEIKEEPLQLSEIIQCLKRIRRSIEMWTKEAGRKGYFDFIDQFLP
jgi:hypothetical protein